jgi:hypothetical protein
MLGLEVGGSAGGVTVDFGDDVAEQMLGGVQRRQGSPGAVTDGLEPLQASARVDEHGRAGEAALEQRPVLGVERIGVAHAQIGDFLAVDQSLNISVHVVS